eukprot:4998441-Lingulodinium_polyedra.AAC.1
MISLPCISSSVSTKAQALSSALLVKEERVSTFFTTTPVTLMMKPVSAVGQAGVPLLFRGVAPALVAAPAAAAPMLAGGHHRVL